MADKTQARIVAHVQPNARQSRVVGLADGVLQVRVAAPPVKGRANLELIALLSDVLGVGRSDLTIEKGVTRRNKTIGVNGLGQDQVARLLERHLTIR
ncbi:MAG: DUF167 domain-containing protein [Dehalococcoidia bacterium]